MDWSQLLTGQLNNFDTSITTRGFTGHEMLDRVGLIHMNGRIYNPALGRFLQADPFVQEPGYSQSYNRYAYVWNNPLNATDPSGYFRLREFVGTIVTIAVSIYCQACGPVVAGMIGGAAGAAANGGNIVQGAFWGGVSAAAFAGIGSHLSTNYSGTFAGGLNATGYGLKIAAHGMAGGVMSVLQGGKFGHGFAAAGFTAAGTAFNNSNHIGGKGFSRLRVANGAVIGGTASKLSGGKFANGAATAAFMVMVQLGMAGAPANGTSTGQSSAPAGSGGQQQLSGMAKALSVIGDVVGKIWNLPNTVIGMLYGGIGHVVGEVGQFLGFWSAEPTISFGNNAIQFVNNPSTDGATTLGNVVVYRGGKYYSPGSVRSNGYTLGYEEMQHTYQGQALGPLYFPAHIGLGISAMISSGQYSNPGWHSSVNVVESCPHAKSPSPWGC